MIYILAQEQRNRLIKTSLESDKRAHSNVINLTIQTPPLVQKTMPEI